jgi:hypothetical protein
MRMFGHTGRVPGWAAEARDRLRHSSSSGLGWPDLETSAPVSSRVSCLGVSGQQACCTAQPSPGPLRKDAVPGPVYAGVLAQPPRPITASHDEAGRTSTVPA